MSSAGRVRSYLLGELDHRIDQITTVEERTVVVIGSVDLDESA
jgi:hypothetical protein